MGRGGGSNIFASVVERLEAGLAVIPAPLMLLTAFDNLLDKSPQILSASFYSSTLQYVCPNYGK